MSKEQLMDEIEDQIQGEGSVMRAIWAVDVLFSNGSNTLLFGRRIQQQRHIMP